MKILSLVLLTAGVFTYGCNKRHECDCAKIEDAYLKAKVVSTSDISCYKPVLDFTEDSARVHLLTNSRSILFNVINLPTNLNIVNNKLYVQVAILTPAEYYPCNNLGVPYPALKVTDATIR